MGDDRLAALAATAAFGIATDRPGNSYLTGFFADIATFGAGEDNETELAHRSRPGYLRREVRSRRPAPLGDTGWRQNTDVGSGIAVDHRGNSYVTGEFRGTATFGAGEDNETELTAAGDEGNTDMFVAKYQR